MERAKQFFDYFFGKGDTVEFKNFTFAHFAPIVILFIIIALITVFRKQIAECRFERNFRFILGFIMIVCEMAYFWRMVGVPSLGANPQEHLPITLCSWSVIFGSDMLVGKSQRPPKALNPTAK